MSILQRKKTKENKGMHYHHIIPKHAGGSDHPDNLILLTPKEHALAHLELYKLYGKQADAWAYNRLIHQAKIKAPVLYVAPNTGKKFSNEINAKKGRKGLQNAMSRSDIKLKHLHKMQSLRGDNRLKNFGLKNPSSKQLVINGSLEFSTIQQAAQHYNVGRDTVRGWLQGKKPQTRFKIVTIIQQ